MKTEWKRLPDPNGPGGGQVGCCCGELIGLGLLAVTAVIALVVALI